jgi:hypothetical protein
MSQGKERTHLDAHRKIDAPLEAPVLQLLNRVSGA